MGFVRFTATVTEEQRKRKEATGQTWDDIIEAGIATAEREAQVKGEAVEE